MEVGPAAPADGQKNAQGTQCGNENALEREPLLRLAGMISGNGLLFFQGRFRIAFSKVGLQIRRGQGQVPHLPLKRLGQRLGCQSLRRNGGSGLP